MKKLKVLLTVFCLQASQSTFAQDVVHLILSDSYPAAGEKIMLTYNPSGTILEDKKNLSGMVFFLDNNKFPMAEFNLKPDGRYFTGKFSIPATAQAFLIKISSGKIIDNNKGNGYVFEIYSNKRPIQGAYASVGYVASSGLAYDLADIQTNDRKGIDLYEKEFRLYPQTAKNESYDRYTDNFAVVLLKEGKLDEALKYQELVYENSKGSNLKFNEHYFQVLDTVKKYDEAMVVAANSIKSGLSSDLLKEKLRKDYLKVKGSDKGYEQYLASLNDAAIQRAKDELAKQMVNQPAPLFELKDLNGKTVSLKDLEGKIVILDFWATWCGPCKTSMAGMQTAVNKYRDNPDIRFLFIDCWETATDYPDLVKEFISDNKYTFDVLLDEKGDDGKQSKVLNAYKIEGIPTKFIIDKKGNIRFKYVGYSGSSESLLDELTMMIDMAGNTNSAKAGK